MLLTRTLDGMSGVILNDHMANRAPLGTAGGPSGQASGGGLGRGQPDPQIEGVPLHSPDPQIGGPARPQVAP